MTHWTNHPFIAITELWTSASKTRKIFPTSLKYSCGKMLATFINIGNSPMYYQFSTESIQNIIFCSEEMRGLNCSDPWLSSYRAFMKYHVYINSASLEIDMHLVILSRNGILLSTGSFLLTIMSCFIWFLKIWTSTQVPWTPQPFGTQRTSQIPKTLKRF